MNALFLTDGYKLDHHKMYPEGTNLVYSNLTPRSNKFAPNSDKVVVVGIQYVLHKIHEMFQENFFDRDKREVLEELRSEYSMYQGKPFFVDHFKELHDLGYLPIKVKAIEEGEKVGMKVPVLTIVNTKPEFFWLTNYLETLMSNMLWLPMTSATTALQYKNILVEWATKTDENNLDFVDFQAHDFSMRGMGGIDSTILSGIGHAMVFSGSDNLPVIPNIRKYYGSDSFIIGGVPATEHSVMCSGTKEGEIDTFKNLIDLYPSGILSVVSDTWDLWKVLTEYLPALKGEIMSRDGKLVVRPDSGDPVDILCGWEHKNGSEKPEAKGVIELLWETFGGTINEQGYKILDSHIGAIYGDSITPERCETICSRLESKGFASTNVVFGIGSFTYQYKTRDTFGFAVKATYIEVDGAPREIFKNPVTDSGIKKSAKGLLRVDKVNGELILSDQCGWDKEAGGELKTVYIDGDFKRTISIDMIRNKIRDGK